MEIGSGGFQFGGNNNGYQSDSFKYAGYNSTVEYYWDGNILLVMRKRLILWAEGGF